jgi:glycosyltransferase involved in cell wall biosynthesis
VFFLDQNKGMNPIFTIITATFNSEKTLERTIKSLLNQSFSNFEYLVIDGNSTDNTLAILNQFKNQFDSKKIHYKFISEKDKGIYDAWNKGLSEAKGDWISFLGSDDYYLENALEKYYTVISNNKCNYVHSRVSLLNEKNCFYKVLGAKIEKKKFYNHMNIAHVGSFHHRSLFINEQFSLKYKSAGDYYFFLKNFEKINSFYFEDITAVMQFGGISTNVKVALKEALWVKIDSKKRNKYLCYLDFFIAHIKHFLAYSFQKT